MRFDFDLNHEQFEARPVGASRLKRLRLSFLDPMDVVDVDKDLIGRAREAVGEFFIHQV